MSRVTASIRWSALNMGSIIITPSPTHTLLYEFQRACIIMSYNDIMNFNVHAYESRNDIINY